MVFKLYVHCDGPPEFSKVFKLSEDSQITAADVLQTFVDAYNVRHGSHLSSSELFLRKERGSAVVAGVQIVEALRTGADLHVIPVPESSRRQAAQLKTAEKRSTAEGVHKAGGGPSVCSFPRPLRGALAESSNPHSAEGQRTRPAAAPAATVATAAALKSSQNEQSGRPTIPRPKASTLPARSESALVKPFMEKGADAESKQHYRIAATIYEQVLNSSPQNRECMVRLISLWRKVKRPSRALELAKGAVEHYPQDAQLRELYAGCLRDLRMREDALQEYDAAVCLAAEQKNSELQNRIQVSVASLLYSMGDQYKDVAASVVMGILEADEADAGALFQYASIAQDRGLTQDATRVFLRLLVLNQDDSKVKLCLAQCLQSKEGMDLVRAELAGSPGSAAALAFLATAVKDHGAVGTCIALFRMAVEAAPESPSYALNLVHALELHQDYGKAVRVTLDFCRTTKLRLGGGFDFGAAAAALEGLPPLTKGYGLEWQRFEPWQPGRATFPTSTDRQLAQNAGLAPDDEEPAARDGDPAEDANDQAEYSAEELDALALLFTAVKVVYLGGAIGRAARLIELLEAARRASRKPLHTTLIRNEAAYFSCIAQLLREHPPPPLGPSQLRPLFLCGDSHTLSGAWHTLTLRGEPRLIMPLLVTGCKIWHLRAAGRFYPKMAWLSTMRALPDASQLIFMFGEIDCREGLLLAVDKLKYDSMADAMAVLVDIYAQALLDLAEQRGFEIFVHPVPSVLNETRHVVRPFNQALRGKIRQVAAVPEAGGRLHWLDLFDQLLTPDGLRMKPSLQFDGTHMNPGCVQIIEDALPSS